MSMYDGLYWIILLMYCSHDMRHIGFPQVDSGQRDPRKLGRHKFTLGHRSFKPQLLLLESEEVESEELGGN